MNVRKALFGFYWGARGALTPTLKYSQYLYGDVLKAYASKDAAWLDLGCGHHILPPWHDKEEKELVGNSGLIVGLDYDLASLKKHKNISLKVRGDITKLPFGNDYFDLVTANMVVEHLNDPASQFREVNRVLKPGGTFIFHTPSVLGYPSLITRMVPGAIKGKLVYLLDGRKEEDIFSVYYRANSKKQIDSLAQATNFEVVKIKMLVSDAIFAVVPPLVVFELAWIKLLMTERFKPLRTNIIAVLKKQTAR